MTKPFAGAVAALLALSLAACGSDSATSGDQSDKLQVVTSFYPLQYVAEQIGGDDVTVVDLTPQGGDAHDLELSPSQVAQVGKAGVVVYLGGGFQASVENAVNAQSANGYDAMTAVTAQQLREGDAHIWLNPLIMAQIGDQVAAEFAEADPDAAQTFTANAASFRQKMEAIDDSYQTGLADCAGATLVTSHEAFGYLADAYGLEQIGITGVNPEAEPSPKRLREVSEIAEENNVKTIFFEQATAAAAEQKLTDTLGISTAQLDPMETTPAAGDYVAGMESNLKALETGLTCSQ